MKMKLVTLFRILIGSAFVSTADAALTTNVWKDTTRSTAFKWETSSEWSLGVPSSAQSCVMIATNFTGMGPAARTVSIDAATVLSNAINGCMTISNLVLWSPSATLKNEVLINNTGSAALTINGDTGHSLIISNGGALVLTSSSLNTADMIVDGGSVVLNSGSITVNDNSLQINNGSMTMFDGFVQPSQGLLIARTVGSAGTFTMAGGTLFVLPKDRAIFVGVAPGATGTVWVTGGQILLTNTVDQGDHLMLGYGGEGSLMQSNGLMNIVDQAVGETSQGTLTMAGGTNIAANMLLIGDQPGSTGAVWVTGGQMVVGDGGVTVGASGVGQMTVSNGTVRVSGEETVARTVGGTLTLAGGSHIIDSPLVIGGPYGGTGTVWVTGGQLLVTNGVLGIVSLQRGSQMTVSNGAVQMFTGLVGDSSGAAGTLTVAGGITSIYSNLTLGVDPCFGSGFVNLSGGELHVTNHNSNSELDILDGTFIMTGGLLDVDRLVITTTCGHFIKLGGTLITGVVVLDPNMDADGDGMPNGYEQANGLDPFDPTGANGPDADLDGDGFTNLQECLAGTDPHDAKSNLHITAVAREGNNVRVTWTTVGGKSYRLLATAGGPGGSFSNNFANFSSIITMPGVGESTTNFLDGGGATNEPARYYQVHLVP